MDVFDVHVAQERAIFSRLFHGISPAINTMTGIEAQTNLRGSERFKETLNLHRGFHVGGNMRMKNEAQAEFSRGILDFCNRRGNLFPLLAGQGLASVHRYSTGKSLTPGSLAVRQNEKLGTESGEQGTNFPDMVDYICLLGGIRDWHGNERRK